MTRKPKHFHPFRFPPPPGGKCGGRDSPGIRQVQDVAANLASERDVVLGHVPAVVPEQRVHRVALETVFGARPREPAARLGRVLAAGLGADGRGARQGQQGQRRAEHDDIAHCITAPV